MARVSKSPIFIGWRLNDEEEEAEAAKPRQIVAAIEVNK